MSLQSQIIRLRELERELVTFADHVVKNEEPSQTRPPAWKKADWRREARKIIVKAVKVWILGQRAQPVTISEETEQAIESAFWAFDTERKRTGAERDAFKGQMRRLLRTVRSV